MMALHSALGSLAPCERARPRCRGRAATPRAAAVDTAPAPSEASESVGFPFVRIVGQEDMKLALQLNVVDVRIGGVLIMGDRGTGKSVAVRALIDLLPQIPIVAGDNYNSHPTDVEQMGPEARARWEADEPQPLSSRRVPMVEVPLGATEDRICGTIDIERALAEGVKAFEPGLLAKANRGILFVDEVNMLDDSLVDVILDSAAGGWNTVEREGISVRHPAKFIMIGSGNSEEGEMRPQLLDRFGMAVQVGTIYDRDARVALVQNRMLFEADASSFAQSCAAETLALRSRLEAARAQLPSVRISRELTLKISEVCSLINVDGLRGDITVRRAAKALCALEGGEEVTEKHIGRVIGLCLSHRLRKDPMASMDNGSKVALAFRRIFQGSEEARESAMAAAVKPAEKKAPEKKAEPKAEPPKKAGAWGGIGR